MPDTSTGPVLRSRFTKTFGVDHPIVGEAGDIITGRLLAMTRTSL